MNARRASVTTLKTPAPRSSDRLLWVAPDPEVLTAMVSYGSQGAALRRFADGWRARDRLLAAGLDLPTRLLLSGPSGTGKTMAARWLGATLSLPIAQVVAARVVDSFMGATARALIEAVDEAVAAAPCILLLDEVDALSEDRSNEQATREIARATGALLQRLDALAPEQIVLASTNVARGVDAALRRRMHDEVVFETPGREVRVVLISRWLCRAGVPEWARQKLADETEGQGGAAIRQAAMALGRAHVMRSAAAKREEAAS